MKTMEASSDDEQPVRGFPGLAKAWTGCFSVNSRFGRQLPWLQFPIPGCLKDQRPKYDPKDDAETPTSKKKDEEHDPHAPTTRALELNAEILECMLKNYAGEFIDIHRLSAEALS